MKQKIEGGKKYDPAIYVCSKCLRACCWRGVLMCEDAPTASIIKRKISTLCKVNEENKDYWNDSLLEEDKPLLTDDNLKKLGYQGT